MEQVTPLQSKADQLYRDQPEQLAQHHFNETGDFRNPYPANTDMYRRYEDRAWQLSLDMEWAAGRV